MTHTFVNQADATLVLSFPNGARIETTRSHPFFVAGRGWVPAGEMGLGTSIVTRAGPSLPVQEIATLEHRSGRRVYNFTVQDFHTYFVGSNTSHALWVHNAGESGWCKVFADTENGRKAMMTAKKYDAAEVLPNGLKYGDAVRNLNLNDINGKSLDEIDAFMRARGYPTPIETNVMKMGPTGQFDEIARFADGSPVPMRVYLHPDGSMVRLKPRGDHPNSPRQQPHVSKSVRDPYDAPHTAFEPFKVDNDGIPVPAGPPHVALADEGKRFLPQPDPNVRSQFTQEALDQINPVMGRAHTNVTVRW